LLVMGSILSGVGASGKPGTVQPRMILTAKTEAAYNAAARLPCSLPLANMQVDIDPAFIACIDRSDYRETSAANDNREDVRAKAQHWRL
jgi:hypothetical protein